MNNNSRNRILQRNQSYLKETLNLSEKGWLNLLAKAGIPSPYGERWSVNNPSAGWCGGVTRALQLAGKTPKDYVACSCKTDAHYYFINPDTREVIDLTIYQFEGEYHDISGQPDYTQYHTRFMNVLSKNVRSILEVLDLEIDSKIFKIKVSRNRQYVSKIQSKEN